MFYSGGNYASATNAGVFYAYGNNNSRTNANTNIGFRSAQSQFVKGRYAQGIPDGQGLRICFPYFQAGS